MKFDSSRIIGWLVPLACIALAGFVILRQHLALQQTTQEFNGAQLQETAAAEAREKAEQQTGTMRVAALSPGKYEEPKFLNGLRSRAAQSGITISKWNSMPRPPANPSATPVDPAIKSIVPIKGDITLDGSYEGIHAFLSALSASNRLYVMSNLRFSRRDKGGVELVASITRYLDPTLPPVTAGPVSQKKS